MAIFAGVIGLVIVAVSLSNIERALWMLIAVAATRGLVRQLYPGFTSYLIVDAMIYLILLHFAIDLRKGAFRNSEKPILLPWSLLFAGVLVIYIFHPNTTVLEALSGLRARVLTVPLFLIGFYYVDSKVKIVRLLHVAIVVGVGVALFGMVQYQYGLGLIESAPSELAEERYQFHYFTEDAYAMRRAFSTFNSSHEFGMFLAIIMILTLGLIFAERKRTKGLLYAVSLVPMGIGLALSSTRSGIAMVISGLIVQVLMLLGRQKIARLFIGGAALTLVYALSDSLSEGMFGERLSLGFDPMYLNERVFFGYVSSVVWPNFLDSPFGHGLSGYLGYIGKDLASGEYNYIEGYYWNILYQVGIAGFVIVVIMFTKIILLGFRAVTKVTEEWDRVIAGSLLGVIVACAVENLAGGSIQSESVGAMFWLAVGIIQKLGFTRVVQTDADAVPLNRRLRRPMYANWQQRNPRCLH